MLCFHKSNERANVREQESMAVIRAFHLHRLSFGNKEKLLLLSSDLPNI